MATCDNCGTLILFGGVRDGDYRFCGTKCRDGVDALDALKKVSETELTRRVDEIYSGPCPVCGGDGPVDLHTSRRIVSVLVLRWEWERPRVSCRRCASRACLGDTFFCLVFGWWSVGGLIMTPFKIGQNLFGVFRGDGEGPSRGLSEAVRADLAGRDLLFKDGPAPGEGPYKAGQVWRYETRDHEPDSRFVIAWTTAVEGDEPFVIYHLSITGLDLAVADGPTDAVQHLPVTKACLDASVTVPEHEPLPDPPDFRDGYRAWLEAAQAGRSGVFDGPLGETITELEAAFGRESVAP